jgi:hypothetical protein
MYVAINPPLVKGRKRLIATADFTEGTTLTIRAEPPTGEHMAQQGQYDCALRAALRAREFLGGRKHTVIVV